MTYESARSRRDVLRAEIRMLREQIQRARYRAEAEAERFVIVTRPKCRIAGRGRGLSQWTAADERAFTEQLAIVLPRYEPMMRKWARQIAGRERQIEALQRRWQFND
jgi:hypothetical protein